MLGEHRHLDFQGLPHKLRDQLYVHYEARLCRGEGTDKAPDDLGTFCLCDLGRDIQPLCASNSSAVKCGSL